MICYDVFEKVSEYLSIQDMISFLMLNKECYGLYKYNKRCNDILFVKKFLQFLNLDTSEYKILDSNARILLKIYFYFKNHPSAHLSDILVYMIDNSIIEYNFFRFVSSKCVFKNMSRLGDSLGDSLDDSLGDSLDDSLVVFTYQSFWDRCENSTYIYTSDIEYILRYGDDKHLDIILSCFDISMVTLSHIFNSRLFSHMKNACGKCLKVLIKYMFIKHCFGMFCSVDQTFFLSCFVSLIKYKKIDVVRYTLEKKRKYIKTGYLDYNYLINQCVKMEDRKIFRLLLDEYKYDNDKNSISREFLVINTHHIINHLRNGKMSYIVYLVEHYLGDSIEVVDSICESIDDLVVKKNFNELQELNNLEKFLSRANFELIRMKLYNVCKKNKIEIQFSSLCI
jgi:hypothetical protein